MSLRAPIMYCLPEDTARVARAAFPKGNAYLRVYDALGPIYSNPQFAALFPKDGQPAIAPAQLALVTIFQFAEGLSDRQAADAVRGRIDWKYALCLELEHPGFDASVLSEFRTRLIAAGAETVLFETLLTTLKEAGLVKPRGRQRTDSTHVLAAIQVLNRLELVGETLRHALNTLAVVALDWLRSQVPADWYPRYSRRFEEYRLPDALTARTALAEQIGADGRALLAMVFASETDAWLRQVRLVETLRRVWVQQFSAEEPARWRAAQDLPPSAVVISSPYDPEARYCKKRETIWTGYKAHLTETCDDDLPNIVTDVDTTTATTVDHAVTAAVQVRLARRRPGTARAAGGHRLRHRRPPGHQPGGPPVHPARPDPRGLQLASAGGRGLRCRPLRDRVGAGACDLPARSCQPDLEADTRQRRPRHHQHPLRLRGLSRLSGPPAVRVLRPRARPRHPPAAVV